MKREKVFETNSSSTHAISISTNENLIDMLFPNSDGVLVFDGGEFGWQWEKFNDAETKANYCAVHVQMYCPGQKELFESAIKEITGAKEIKYNFSSDYGTTINYAYIDHDSVGVVGKAFESENTLKRFIFCFESWLCLGNDNEDPPEGFYEGTGINKDY
jgi:hypothetical protein